MAADQNGSGPPRPGGILGMIALPGGANASKYDEAEFLVGGRGKSGGELTHCQFKLHEGYATEASRWLESKKFPYKTKSDLYKHAVVRHLRYFLPAMEGEVEGTLLNEMAQVDELVAYWRMQNEFIEQIDKIAEEVTKTLQMPDGKREVERMLRRIKQRIDATKPSYHKGVYQKMFNDRFGAYLPKLALALARYGSDDSGVVEFPLSAYESFDNGQSGDDE